MTIGALVCVWAVAEPALASIYTCTDKSGRTWVTNRKVKGARCRMTIKIAPPKARPKQASAGGAAPARAERFVPPASHRPSGADEPAKRADRERLYGPYIEEAARLYALPEALIRAVIRVESNYKYRARSSAGAMGLMQLMPVVVREMDVADPWDARDNILGGAKLLRVLANRFDGDFVSVLGAYYAGSGAVKRAGGTPNEETDGYVRAVLDHYYQYKALGPP